MTLFVAAAFILLRSFLLLLLRLPPPSELLLLLVLTRFLILISDLFLELLLPIPRTSLDMDGTLAKAVNVSSLAMQSNLIAINYWQFWSSRDLLPSICQKHLVYSTQLSCLKYYYPEIELVFTCSQEKHYNYDSEAR